MKALFGIAVAVLTASTALADALPISGTFGNSMGCAVAAGRDSVGDPESILYVTPTEVYGFEYGCLIGSIAGNHVSLSCDGEGDHYEWSATFRTGPDSLIWQSQGDKAVVLHACK